MTPPDFQMLWSASQQISNAGFGFWTRAATIDLCTVTPPIARDDPRILTLSKLLEAQFHEPSHSHLITICSSYLDHLQRDCKGDSMPI